MKIALDTLEQIIIDVSQSVEMLRGFAGVKEFRAVLELSEDDGGACLTVTMDRSGKVEVETCSPGTRIHSGLDWDECVVCRESFPLYALHDLAGAPACACCQFPGCEHDQGQSTRNVE